MNSAEASELRAAIADSATDLLSRTDHRQRLRRLREAPLAFERELWLEIAEAGWPAILLPEADDGLGLGLEEAAVVAESAGEHLLPEPYLPAFQAAWILADAPRGSLRTRLLEELLGGGVLGLAWQEQPAQLEPAAGTARLSTAETGWRLQAHQRFIEPAGADGYLLLAQADEPVLLWLPAQCDGLRAEARRRVDGILLAELEADGVRVSDEQILIRGEAATAAVAGALDIGRILQAAELIGIARRLLEITLDYVGARKQFGRPIGAFQALQHRLVDARLQIDLASAALDEVLAQSEAELSAGASRVKARASAAALHMARLAIQLHGAMGNTDECEVGLYFKRALALDASLGNAEAHRRRYAELLATVSPDVGAAARQELAGDPPLESLSEEQVRLRVRGFLERHYPSEIRHLPRAARWSEIGDWRRLLYQQGWVAPAWPKEYGGLGLSAAQLMAYHEEMQHYGVARFIDMGVEMLGPVLISHGSEAQRDYYLPRILSGEHIWCQGYSEPNAGSDLAALSTTGVIDGEEMVITGRKIWTSHADEATHIFMLVRTDRDAKPQAGISFVLVDLATPGIEIRPIRDLRGDEPFCEVTFDEVRVPLTNLVGRLNDGWGIAKSLLGFERLAIANPAPAVYALDLLGKLGRQAGRFADADFRRRYAELTLDVADLGALYRRFADLFKRGEPLGEDISLLKVCSTDTWQQVAQYLLESAGEAGTLLDPLEIGDERVDILAQTYSALPASIYSGSNEIQKNIAARRVLGLGG